MQHVLASMVLNLLYLHEKTQLLFAFMVHLKMDILRANGVIYSVASICLYLAYDHR